MTTAVPTDAEMLALCRQRLHTVEQAILDYLDAIEATGKERQAAYQTVQDVLADGGGPAALLTDTLRDFYDAYEGTLPARRAAAEALLAALTTDWRTEILCAGDMTDKQRAEWLSKSAETGRD